jgi:4-hydroxy-2-oxoheptanedioate aldolase
MKSIQELAAAGKPVLGTWVSIADAGVIEMAKWAGFDYIRIDNEYTPFNPAKLAELIRTANLLKIPVHVRISRMEDIVSLISFGANGIIVPDCNTVERAKEAIDRIKYYPIGKRGVNPDCRASHIAGCTGSEYLKKGNDLVSLTIQIEDVKVASYIDEIVSLEGIDMISSGRNDISQSFGCPGEIRHPKALEFEDLIIKKALKYGKLPVILANTREEIVDLTAKDVHIFTVGNDEAMLRAGMKDRLAVFR